MESDTYMSTAPTVSNEIRSLLAKCLNVFGSEWTADSAAALHEQIERAAEVEAEAVTSSSADLLLELSVFLCSLVDVDGPPSEGSKVRVAAMCARISPELPTATEPTRHAQPQAEPRAPLVILLVSPGSVLLNLSAEIGHRKLLVAQVDSLDALAGEVSRRAVTVVVISPEWGDRAAEVVAQIERAHPQPLTQPGTVMLIGSGDRARRMFALRAGVDQVVESKTNAALADDIAAFVRKRQHSAFRVLIVEDDLGQAMFAQKVLGHRGMETRVARSAEEALLAVDGFNPDLCLLDLNLPDRNGIELAQMLREKPGFELVQIVFLTGELSPEARTLAIRLGADDWILKPVRPRDLLAVVESRAERARRAAPHDPIAGLGRDAARGVHSRRRIVGAIGNAISTATEHEGSVLIAVAPQATADALVEVSWEDQATLGGELARALRADSLVRSEVCQAETMTCLLIVDPTAASQVGLAAIASGLDRRQWLTSVVGMQLPFAVAGIVLDSTQSAHRAVDEVLALLRKAQQQAPRVRFQAGANAALVPPGWPELRAIFANDALGRSHRLLFHPLMPVTGSRAGQFLLSAEFEVALSEGGSTVPDHRLFARTSGFHLKLDQWMLARCLDRLRMSRNGLSLVVEVSPESIDDPGFAAWLASELARRKMISPQLTLLVSADRLRSAGSRASSSLQPLTALGVRIALGPLTDNTSDLALVRLDEVHMVTCLAKPQDGEIPDALLAAAQEYGKLVWVTEVDDSAAAGSLFRQAVHYVSGLAITPPLTRPEFDFPAA